VDSVKFGRNEFPQIPGGLHLVSNGGKIFFHPNSDKVNLKEGKPLVGEELSLVVEGLEVWKRNQ